MELVELQKNPGEYFVKEKLTVKEIYTKPEIVLKPLLKNLNLEIVGSGAACIDNPLFVNFIRMFYQI